MAKTLGGEDKAEGPARTQDAADQALSSAGLAQARAVKGPPPVHLWNPPFCGDLDMRITRDGTWIHEGRPITRHPLVQLFGAILKREGADYMLVTPVEKVRILVEDVPFIAIDVDHAEGGFTFTTNLGDRVTAGPDNPLEMRGDVPYLHIRRDLWARIDRKTFYRLAAALEEEGGRSGIRSLGQFFPLESISAE